jgi:DNA-binding NtrC family response regulator
MAQSTGRIVIVDDRSESRAAMLDALAGEGLDVVGSTSVDAARDVASADLVVIDLMLHGTNGFELARRLRAVAPEVEVVLTSEFHFSPVQLASVDCGAVAFVPRPYAPTLLARFVRERLESRRAKAGEEGLRSAGPSRSSTSV